MVTPGQRWLNKIAVRMNKIIVQHNDFPHPTPPNCNHVQIMHIVEDVTGVLLNIAFAK